MSGQCLGVRHLREAPIEHYRFAKLPDHDVIRLDVAVNHATTVSVGDSLARSTKVIHEIKARSQARTLFDCNCQCPTLDHWHRVIDGAVWAFSELVNTNDIRVLELAGDPRLTDESQLRLLAPLRLIFAVGP